MNTALKSAWHDFSRINWPGLGLIALVGFVPCYFVARDNASSAAAESKIVQACESQPGHVYLHTDGVCIAGERAR